MCQMNSQSKIAYNETKLRVNFPYDTTTDEKGLSERKALI
jgi:hypothetical protein